VTAINCNRLDNDLAQVNGRPAICYWDDISQDLYYAYVQNDGTDSLNWHRLMLDDSGSVGRYPSLAVINDVPAVAYSGNINGALHYAYATSVDGANPTDWHSIIVDSSSPRMGNYPSLALVYGTPAIAYADYYNLELKYARASTPRGMVPAD